MLDCITVHGMTRAAAQKPYIVAVATGTGRKSQWWYRCSFNGLTNAMKAANELHGTVIPSELVSFSKTA